MTEYEFKGICDLTFKLTELRQNECKHLSVENIAPTIFRELINIVSETKKEESVVNIGRVFG